MKKVMIVLVGAALVVCSASSVFAMQKGTQPTVNLTVSNKAAWPIPLFVNYGPGTLVLGSNESLKDKNWNIFEGILQPGTDKTIQLRGAVSFFVATPRGSFQIDQLLMPYEKIWNVLTSKYGPNGKLTEEREGKFGVTKVHMTIESDGNVQIIKQ